MYGLIYIATQKDIGDQYVGLTTQKLESRAKQHFRNAKTNPKTHFHRAIAKYGQDTFEFTHFASAIDNKYLSELEQIIIKQLRPRYNQTNGGEVTIGRKYTDDVKAVIRQKNVGKVRTDAHKRAISAIKKDQYQRLSDKQKEQVLAHLTRIRMLVDEEKRIQNVRTAARNREWTAESRKKLSDACKGRVYSKEIIDKMRKTKTKQVVCVNTGEVYASRYAVQEQLGVSAHTVCKICNMKRPAVKGLTFRYLEKQL